MEHSDSRDKTHSMIEKITFSAPEKGVCKKLMFQSSRCGGSPGFWKSKITGVFTRKKKNMSRVPYDTQDV